MHVTDAVLLLNRLSLTGQAQPALDALKSDALLEGAVYAASLSAAGQDLLCLARLDGEKRVLAVSRSGEPGRGFEGEAGAAGGGALKFKSCPLTAANAEALRRALPWTAPVSLASRRTTFGCGDRLGRATPGHLRAARRFRVSPVLAQQSMRELTLTGRTFRGVVDDATFAVFQSGYTEGYGADADHLKTLEHISAALDCGMTMITLDLSEVMRPQVAAWSDAEVAAGFAALPAGVRARVSSEYAGRTIAVEGAAGRTTVALDAASARRCAVMYTPALDFAAKVHDVLAARRGLGHFDLEIGIDETTTPTLPSHHLFLIRELQQRGVTVVSLAPRFIGEFQKGIDYVGDLAEFEKQFREHAIIAQAHGDYKISIHSGSDKFSILPIVGRVTGGRFHEKTAGTSWLEAVRLTAQKDPALYRRFHETALRRLPDAQKLYHITPDLARIAPLRSLRDEDLPALMDQDPARQVLHVAYGFILEDEAMKREFFALLDRHEDDHYALLDRHFTRHMESLGIAGK